jgi:Holliday junction resolvase RusA-like endonuclease
MFPAVLPPEMPMPSPISSPLISPPAPASKKNKARPPASGRTPKKKKNKKREARFQYCLGDTFKATGDSLKVVIRGRPVTWKRPGESISGTRYNASQADENDFAGALKDAYRMNKKTIEKWEKTCELKASFAFALPKKGSIVQPPDLDNLIKLVKAAMQGVLYANDAQISKYTWMEKRFDASFGGKGHTLINLSKRVIEIKEDNQSKVQRKIKMKVESSN